MHEDDSVAHDGDAKLAMDSGRASDAGAVRAATLGRLNSLDLGDDDPGDGSGGGLSAVELRSVDDEPASLVYDSSLDVGLLASVRSGAATTRQMTFQGRDLLLELEVSGPGHLVGQVVPPQPAVVELRHRGGTTKVEADLLGCFELPHVPDGPVSLRCRPSDTHVQPVATSWITL